MTYQTILPYGAATLVILALYLLARVSVKDRWEHRIFINPLKIIAASNRRASLSSAQIAFFTAVVLWVAAYWAFKTGSLVMFDGSVLALLGITVAGTSAGKITDSTRFRLTSQNWSWAKSKGWIKKDFTGARSDHSPGLGDLVSTDHGFDMTRLQAVGFSLLVGISLLYAGVAAESAASFSQITVPNVYLGLIGISQGAYVAGKYTGGNLYRELDTQLDNIRRLEAAFVLAVVNSPQWNEAAPPKRTIDLAGQCAADEYHEYLHAAREAAVIVSDMTGNVIGSKEIEPSLPAKATTSSS